MTDRIEVFAVDRVEGTVVVLVSDEGDSMELPRALLRGEIREGAVLRVPIDGQGEPQWDRAERAIDIEEQRLEEARHRLEALKKRDPGGDVVL